MLPSGLSDSTPRDLPAEAGRFRRRADRARPSNRPAAAAAWLARRIHPRQDVPAFLLKKWRVCARSSCQLRFLFAPPRSRHAGAHRACGHLASLLPYKISEFCVTKFQFCATFVPRQQSADESCPPGGKPVRTGSCPRACLARARREGESPRRGRSLAPPLPGRKQARARAGGSPPLGGRAGRGASAALRVVVHPPPRPTPPPLPAMRKPGGAPRRRPPGRTTRPAGLGDQAPCRGQGVRTALAAS
jgi:hypothetical protein